MDLVTYTGEILNGKLHFLCNERLFKGFSYTMTIIEKFVATGRTDWDTMDFATKPIEKARERY